MRLSLEKENQIRWPSKGDEVARPMASGFRPFTKKRVLPGLGMLGKEVGGNSEEDMFELTIVEGGGGGGHARKERWTYHKKTQCFKQKKKKYIRIEL